MSGVIDTNVVKMVFESAGFVQNAESTLSILDRLKGALNFKGAVQGLENIGANVKNIGMDGLYTGVYKVQDSFNVLDVVATRVIQNITDRVQGAVHQLATAAITKPLKDGFSEYELQMNSVQTITASTGESIASVNGYLDKLNEYADKTIYSFSDMTTNIGKFTNAGVKLDRAVAAIQGISNVAAVSGANTNEASRAMYNFAQALSAGSVKLIDWKSIENANMATVEFKNQLINTAVAMGTLTKKGDEYVSTTKNANGKTSEAFTATKNFNDSLQSQWMTEEVLVQTLEQYSTDVREMTAEEEKAYRAKLMSIYGDEKKVDSIIELAKKAANAAKDVKTFSQLIDTLKESLGSGWTKTWQYIFGDLNEAKALWTGINNVLSGFIDKVSDSRNSMLETWHKSGYTLNKYGEVIKAYYDSEGKLVDKLPENGKLFDKHGKEVKAVVDEETKEIVPELIKNGKMIREEMGGRDFLIEGLKNDYNVFATIAKQFTKSLDKNFFGDGKQLRNISITGQTLISLSEAFYDSSIAFNNAWTKMKKGKPQGLLKELRDSFDSFTSSLRTGVESVSDIFSGLGNIFKAFKLSDFFNIGTLDSIIKYFSGFVGVLDRFGEAFKENFGNDALGLNKSGLITFFNAIVDTLESKAFIKLDLMVGIFDALGSVLQHIIAPFGTFSQILGNVSSKWIDFVDAIENVFYDKDESKFESLFKTLADSLNQFINTLKDKVDFSAFSDLFDSIIKMINNNDTTIFGIIADSITSITNVIKTFLGIASPLTAALAKMLGPFLGDAVRWISDLAARFEDFTASLVPNSKVIKGLQTLFEGIFSVLSSVANLIGDVVIGAWDALGSIFKDILPTDMALSDTLTGVGDTLKTVSKIIDTFVSGDGAPKLSDVIKKMGERFGDLLKTIGNVNPLEKLRDVFVKLGDGIKHALGGSKDMSLLDTITEKIKKFLQSFKDMISDSNGNLDAVKLFEAGGIGYGIKKLIDLFKELKSGTGNLKGVLTIISDFKQILEDFVESLGDKFKAEVIKAVGVAMLEVAGAMFILSMIDSGALAKSIAAMMTIFREIERILVILSSLDKGKVAAGAAAIGAMGTAILELSAAIAILGGMELGSMVQGLVGVSILLGELTAVAYAFSKFDNDLAKGAAGLVLLAFALDLLVIPVKSFSKLSWENLIKGLLGVTVLLGGLVLAVDKMADKTENMVKAGIGILLISKGIGILAKAVVAISGLSWEGLSKGLAVFAVSLVAMVKAAQVISDGNLAPSLLALGGAMMMLGVAMNFLAAAGIVMMAVSWESLGKMAAVLAGALIMLGAASYLINGPNLLMVAGAIALVATAFLELNAAVGIAQIVGPLCTSIGLAIEGMSSSLQSFARSEAANAFLSFLENAILFLPKLAVGLAKAIIALIVELGNGIAQIVSSIVKIGKAILVGIATLISETSGLIIKTIVQLGKDILQGIGALLPDIFNLIAQALSQILIFLVTMTPRIAAAALVMLEQFMAIMTTHIPVIANLGMEMVIAFINGLANAIDTNSDALLAAVQHLITSLVMFLLNSAGMLFETAGTLISTFISGIFAQSGSVSGSGSSIIASLVGALLGGAGKVISSAFLLMGNFVKSIVQRIPQVASAAGQMISRFVSGIAAKAGSVISAGANLISKVKAGISRGIGSLYSSGANAIQGFINGMTSKAGAIWSTAASLAQSAWNAVRKKLKEHSPSRVMFASGVNFAQGFINGSQSKNSDIDKNSKALVDTAMHAFDKANTTEHEFSITPVIDDSKMANSSAFMTLSNLSVPDNISVTYNLSNIDNLLKDSVNTQKSLYSLLSSANLGIDYNKLGESLAKSLINSGLHVQMDGGQLMGYLAGEIRDARRMYG